MSARHGCSVLAWAVACLAMLVLAPKAAQAQSTTNSTSTAVTASTPQQLADVIAAWGLGPGGPLSIQLSLGYMPMMNVSFVNWTALLLNGSSSGIRPFRLPGELTISGRAAPGGRTILNNAMRRGLLPPLTSNTVFMENIVVICSCETVAPTSSALSPNQVTISAFNGGGIISSNRAYAGTSCRNSEVYVRPAEISRQLYLKLMQQTPFSILSNLTVPLFVDISQVYYEWGAITPNSLTFATFAGPSGTCTNLTLKSYRNPDDPVLQFLASQGHLFPLSLCSGVPIPPEVINLKYSPLAPALPTFNTTMLQQNLREAAEFTARSTPGWNKFPPMVLLHSATPFLLPTTPLPPFSYPCLITGPVQHVPTPEVAATTLDMQQAKDVMLLAPTGQLFFQQLVLTNLASRALPSTPSVSSALPLAAITPPPGWELASAPAYVYLYNTTLVLPPADYLALATLALAHTPDSIASCVEPVITTHAAALNAGIRSMSGGAWDTRSRGLHIALFVGWGMNASVLTVVPASPVPAYQHCAQHTSKCGAVSCGALAGIIVGSVAAACLVVGLVLFLLKRSTPDWHEPSAEAYQIKAGKEAASGPQIQVHLQSGSRIGSVVETCSTVRPSAAGLGGRWSMYKGQSSQSTITPNIASYKGSSLTSPGPASSGGQDRQQTGGDSLDSHHHSSTSTGQLTSHHTPDHNLRQMVMQKSLNLKGDADHVVVTGILGQGSHGQVYSGTWRGLPVAIKTVIFQDTRKVDDGSQVLGAPALPNRAVMEAAIAASVAHSNVVATYVYDLKPITEIPVQEQDEGLQIVMGGPAELEQDVQVPAAFKLFLVQELCDFALDHVITEDLLRDPVTQAPDWDSIYCLLIDIARGLEYLHSRNIIHGDLKPANVLLKINTSRSSQVDAKLADFGLSSHLAGNATHVSNFRAGTPFYVAPEIVLASKSSPAADMYSFGVVCWECAACTNPYVTDAAGQHSWHPLFPDFEPSCKPPLGYLQLMHRCLSRNPRERPTASEAVQMIDRIWS